MKAYDTKTGGGLFARAKERLAAYDERQVDRVILSCRCARHDTPFEAAFERHKGADDNIFRFKEILTPKGKASGSKSAQPQKQSLPIEEIKLSSLECPHCESENPGKWVRCGGCKAFVCGARSERQGDRYYFRCGPSCGNEGLTIDLTTVNAHRAPTPSALRLPGKRTPRLPGKSGVLRITDQR